MIVIVENHDYIYNFLIPTTFYIAALDYLDHIIIMLLTMMNIDDCLELTKDH